MGREEEREKLKMRKLEKENGVNEENGRRGKHNTVNGQKRRKRNPKS